MRRAPATILACATVALLYVRLGAGSLQAADIFADGRLAADITDSYSIAGRDDSGKDGDAYEWIDADRPFDQQLCADEPDRARKADRRQPGQQEQRGERRHVFI